MRPRRAAFTLIELLVVIAIISLLVSILMPSLSAARRQAKASVCLSNLRRLATGMNIYISNSREQFPPFRLKKARPTTNDLYVNKFGRKEPRWHWFVDPEEVGPVIDPEPFFGEIESSGSFGDNSIGANGELGTAMTNKYFLCPSLSDQQELDERNGAYGYNYQYLGNARTDTDAQRWDNFPVGISRIRSGSQTVLLGDSRGAGKEHGKHSYTLDPPRLAIERDAKIFGPGDNDVPAGLEKSLYRYSPVEMRHGQRGTVVFVDSHAESMTLEELGYQVNKDGVAEPILDPLNGPYEATNKLWNGEAMDEIAQDARRGGGAS